MNLFKGPILAHNPQGSFLDLKEREKKKDPGQNI